MRISDWSSDVCSSDLVAFAIGRNDVVVWNIAPIVQPRPHGVALKQALRGATSSGMSRVSTAVWAARTGIPMLSHVASRSISGMRGLGGGIRQSEIGRAHV